MVLASRLSYRSPSLGSAQSAYGSRSAKSAGNVAIGLSPLRRCRDADGRLGPTGLVVVDVLLRRLVEVAQHDLLVTQRELGDHAGLEHRLRGLQRVGVLEAVLLERDDGELL